MADTTLDAFCLTLLGIDNSYAWVCICMTLPTLPYQPVGHNRRETNKVLDAVLTIDRLVERATLLKQALKAGIRHVGTDT